MPRTPLVEETQVERPDVALPEGLDVPVPLSLLASFAPPEDPPPPLQVLDLPLQQDLRVLQVPVRPDPPVRVEALDEVTTVVPAERRHVAGLLRVLEEGEVPVLLGLHVNEVSVDVPHPPLQDLPGLGVLPQREYVAVGGDPVDPHARVAAIVPHVALGVQEVGPALVILEERELCAALGHEEALAGVVQVHPGGLLPRGKELAEGEGATKYAQGRQRHPPATQAGVAGEPEGRAPGGRAWWGRRARRPGAEIVPAGRRGRTRGGASRPRTLLR
mmetsp:Transcript_11309/g.34474  ORF Transcript_11309/g.34474 Transcript_11309/m.34474 type:complete len:274 (-) Transcript_11309:175-996(-)